MMRAQDIINQCRELTIDEERCLTEAYAEVVFFTKDEPQWTSVLEGVFGPVEKATGKRPSREHLHVTKEYGSIWPNQTLFKKEEADVLIIAMYWPWQDGVHITLKVGVLEK